MKTDSLKSFLAKNKERMLDSIKGFKSLFMLAEDITYYEESTIRLINLLEQANGLLYDGMNTGNNVNHSVDLVDQEIERILVRIRKFVNKDWNLVESKVKNEKIRLIPELKEF